MTAIASPESGFFFGDAASGSGAFARLTYGSLDLTGIRVEVLDPSPAPVPLPAGLPLMALALGAIGLVRRLRSA